MTMKERKEFEHELASYLEEKIATLKRQLARTQSVERGEAVYAMRWRSPYKEKKIRSYSGHWVHIIHSNPKTKKGDK